jgi:hypothetical protein
MKPCDFCAGVGPGYKYKCPFCGRKLNHYLPTEEQIRERAHEARYHREEDRLKDPAHPEGYLPW